MEYEIEKLERNQFVFEQLLKGYNAEQYLWRENPEKWNLLEVVSHLYDEEREDFRARVQSVLEDPARPFVSIDPAGWVKSRNYDQANFEDKIKAFLNERKASIVWLRGLKNPNWNNAYDHPKVGPVSAGFLLTNWVAHDYLHLRQIIRIDYNYLQSRSEKILDYAGNW